MKRGDNIKRWSDDEVARLMSIHRQFKTERPRWASIAARMPGRTARQCQEKVRYQHHGPHNRDVDVHRVLAPVVTPANVWADAEHRRRLSRPNITAEFFG